MMNLLSNMDLKGTKDNIWLKPIIGIELFCPPAKAGGYSKQGVDFYE